MLKYFIKDVYMDLNTRKGYRVYLGYKTAFGPTFDHETISQWLCNFRIRGTIHSRFIDTY